MKGLIIAAAAALGLAGCVAVPAPYGPDAYYYPRLRWVLESMPRRTIATIAIIIIGITGTGIGDNA
jgi:hypothetical protein